MGADDLGMEYLPVAAARDLTPEPERVASGELASSEPLVRDLAGSPHPHPALAVAGSVDLHFLACRLPLAERRGLLGLMYGSSRPGLPS